MLQACLTLKDHFQGINRIAIYHFPDLNSAVFNPATFLISVVLGNMFF